ncbi:MAG: hypothetical protein IJ880_16530 [Bacilli bacterium]|nr:hypothetical protein [Bacilli bacterium]
MKGICKICGKKIESKEFRKTCSKKCSEELKQKRIHSIKHICIECNKEFYGTCSRRICDECNSKKKTIKKCKICNKTFIVNTCIEKRFSCCSKECSKIYNQQIRNKILQDNTVNDKRKKTTKERYGNENYRNYNKSKQTKIKRYGNLQNANNHMIQTYQNTCLKKYGVKNASILPDTILKISNTKRKNNTFNISKPQQEMKNILIEKFGQNDVICEYNTKIYENSDRYPFDCDFYIKSLDLFIEYNGTWTHGPKKYKCFYDSNNKEHIQIVKIWKEKAKYSKYYKQALKTWTINDVNKRNIAIQNNLNYLVFWDKKLKDFKEWINAYFICGRGNNGIGSR